MVGCCRSASQTGRVRAAVRRPCLLLSLYCRKRQAVSVQSSLHRNAGDGGNAEASCRYASGMATGPTARPDGLVSHRLLLSRPRRQALPRAGRSCLSLSLTVPVSAAGTTTCWTALSLTVSYCPGHGGRHYHVLDGLVSHCLSLSRPRRQALPRAGRPAVRGAVQPAAAGGRRNGGGGGDWGGTEVWG